MLSHREASIRSAAVPPAVGPACPQNWYLVAQSHELKAGAILARRIGDAEIVVYRGYESGRIVAFAAHCAHAGCHLRHGKVVGDDLRCALHHRTIDPDGCFVGKDRTVLPTASQFRLPAIDRIGCIFVFAGEKATFDLPLPDICASGPVTTRALPTRILPLPWSTLSSNGMDLDHLQAVHDRKLRAAPTLRRLDEYGLRLDYRAGVTGSHLSDRIMKWISDDEIRVSITCVGGSMMLVESSAGRHRTFVIISMCPSGPVATTVRAVAGVAGAPGLLRSQISAGLTAWLFHAFLRKDVGVLQEMDWHEPDYEITLGDSLMRSLCEFFRMLPEFDGGRAPAMATDSTLAALAKPPANSLGLTAHGGCLK
jgi:nitrite reductase/ring-hydroxylating ferredoxin subunit